MKSVCEGASDLRGWSGACEPRQICEVHTVILHAAGGGWGGAGYKWLPPQLW